MSKPNESSAATSARSPGESAVPDRSRSPFKWIWLILPLGYLWFHLIDNLRVEWDTSPQYSYGFIVPLLVMGLLLRRWQNVAHREARSVPGNPWPAVLLCGFLALLYAPTRLIEAATPEWRPIQWCAGIEVIGLTLYAIYLVGGKSWLRQAAFPVTFFLVAIPWPSPIEIPIIQGLSRMNAAMVVQVLFFLNVPAVQHGNLIEVSTGMVGINDACSGIRSCQSSLMIALFLGEFYLFDWLRRLILLPVSLAIAMLLNCCRTSLLTWLAAKKGIGAIAEYHDETGMTILLICTALLWCTGWWLNHRRIPAGNNKTAAATVPLSRELGIEILRRANRFGFILIVWLVMVATGVELWFRIRESHLKRGPDWTVALPEQDPTFSALPFTQEEHVLLRFDQGKQGQWRGSDGSVWQTFYYNWVPGRVAGYLAKRHTPDICMTATGYKMTAGPELMVLNVKDVELPMRHYVFDSASGPLQVYQCHWEAGMGKDSYTADESTRFNLIRGIWAGRGNQGQKVLEIIIAGYDNADMAKQALVRELENLIQVEN